MMQHRTRSKKKKAKFQRWNEPNRTASLQSGLPLGRLHRLPSSQDKVSLFQIVVWKVNNSRLVLELFSAAVEIIPPAVRLIWSMEFSNFISTGSSIVFVVKVPDTEKIFQRCWRCLSPEQKSRLRGQCLHCFR